MADRPPIHPQTSVTDGAESAQVDVELAALIRELWRVGIGTNASCQEHEGTGKVWVEFRDPDAARQFLNRTVPQVDEAGSMWRRASDWGFGSRMTRAGSIREGDWEYYVSVRDLAYDECTHTFKDDTHGFWLTVSVLFPRSDLDAVIANLRHYNDTGQFP